MEVESPSVDQEQLVRGLAHRMNNILTVFHGYVGLMLDNQDLDASTRDGLTRIKAGARAATELMDRAHSLVRRPAIVCRELDVPGMVRLLHPAIQGMQKPNTLYTFHEPGPLPHAIVDTGRLRTAILELLRNAFEAAAILPAGGRVDLTMEVATALEDRELSVHAAGATWLRLAVEDNGQGIPPSIADKIFQPFFSTKRKHNATGLGLNVAQGLMRECGGLVRHADQPFRTRFEILVPAVNS